MKNLDQKSQEELQEVSENLKRCYTEEQPNTTINVPYSSVEFDFSQA